MIRKPLPLLALLLFCSSGLFAQTPFYSYDFTDSLDFVTNWTTGGSNNGPEDWKWQDSLSETQVENVPAFGAPTATTGFAIFDSDANGENFHDVFLTSPVIDCSGEDTVYLRFNAQYLYFSRNPFSVVWLRTRVNGAIVDSVRILSNVPPLTISGDRQIVLQPLPAAVGEANVQFDIRWEGFFEFFLKLDDVELYGNNPHQSDLKALPFYSIAPNVATPASQLDTVRFLNDFFNVGSQEQPSSKMFVTVVDEETDNLVYLDSLEFGPIGADSIVQNAFFPGGFFPGDFTANYRVNYTLVPETEDEAPFDNQRTFRFFITDSLFSKDNGPTIAFTPVDDNSYAHGNIYYVPNGEGHSARTISFGISNAEELAGTFLTVKLYKFEDQNGNLLAEDAELSLLGFNSYEVTGSEGFNIISVPINLDDPEGKVPLEDNSFYLPVVEYNAEDNTPMFLFNSEEFDYLNMFFQTDSLGQTRYASALDVGLGAAPEFSLVGFGFGTIPVVRMSVLPDEATSVFAPERLPEGAVSVYPNPTRGVFRAELDFAETAREVNVLIMDIAGKVILNQRFEQVRRQVLPFDLSELANGTYLFKVSTEAGAFTERLILQK